jgi:CRP-like cAMP-binding protein
VPLFSSLTHEDTELLLRTALERRVQPGEVVIEQWDTARDLIVIISGRVRVLDGGRELARVQAGDFVGEFAALDWGAGYGSVRLATVQAETAGTVLQFAPEELSEILRRSPEARELVERTARARMAQLP